LYSVQVPGSVTASGSILSYSGLKETRRLIVVTVARVAIEQEDLKNIPISRANLIDPYKPERDKAFLNPVRYMDSRKVLESNR
jgi:hypothetical protein